MAAYPRSVITGVFKVEALLGRVWKHPNLLAEALCHPSFRSNEDFGRLAEALCHPSFRSNEDFGRLAFAGESVIHFCVMSYFRWTFPRLGVNHLSQIIADNISRQNYARRAVNSGLHQYLHHHVHADRYARSLMTEGCMEPLPEALGEMVEAIAGAVYVDSDKDAAEVWRVLKPILQPLIIKPRHLNYVGADGRLQIHGSTSKKSPPSNGQSSNTDTVQGKSTTLSSINDMTEQKCEVLDWRRNLVATGRMRVGITIRKKLW